MVHIAPSWCTSSPYTVVVVYNVPWVHPDRQTDRQNPPSRLSPCFFRWTVFDVLLRILNIYNFSTDDMFHSLSDAFNTMDKYVKDTVNELDEGTLGTYNKAIDEVK